MATRRKYRKKHASIVTAVRLDLDTDGFSYHKWGHDQRCQRGDWIVNNEGDTYTVSHESFIETYQEVSPGAYRKVAPVWAQSATAPGSVATREGRTAYDAGDYLVSNREDGSDAYAVSREKFEAMYELVPED